MSPEQVKGHPADHRSDIFSFGAILYEMLTGQRAFKRDTSAETMTAILKDDPPELSPRAAVAPALDRIARHCMEKQPAQRFQSAHDIAFDLESVSGVSTVNAPAVTPSRKAWLVPAIISTALFAMGLALGIWMHPQSPKTYPKLHRITFRRGTIWSARFTPDGNLIYSGAWDGRPMELFSAQPSSTESRPLNMPSTGLFAISTSGELAVSTNIHLLEGWEYTGMLARNPEGGGAPRDIADGVEFADWSPDGTSLAIVRRAGGKVRLEYPIGKVLSETASWISHPRVSPDGKLVAFLDHPYALDDGGYVAVVDQAGNKKTLTKEFVSEQGLAWWPSGKEIWFTATTSGSSRELRAVTLAGKERLVYLGTGTLTLHDISKDGRVLFCRDDMRAGMTGLAPGEKQERDLSWHDWTIPRDVSDDGTLVSFDETGEAGGATGVVYVRRTDGSPAVRLSDGVYPVLSPDGKRVLAMTLGAQRNLVDIPTGAGQPHVVSTGDVQVQRAFFFPDGRHILEVGSASGGHGLRLWIQDGDNGTPRPISPEGASFSGYRGSISPDGKRVAALNPQGKPVVYDVAGGPSVLIPSVETGELPVEWTADGRSLLVGGREIPTRVFIINLDTGQRKLFKAFSSSDPTGLVDNSPPEFSRDLKSYVYGYTRITSDLYIVDGLK